MRPSPLRQPPARGRQRGIALIVGMVILVVLALLGMSAYSVATQDERIAGNTRDHARALDAAETMLRECEAYIQNYQQNNNNQPLAFTQPATVAGMVAAPTPGNPFQGDLPYANWPTAYTLPTSKWPRNNWSLPPECIAEEFDLPNTDAGVHRATQAVGTTPPLHVARITAVGFGVSSSTQVTVISYYSFY